ncbi:hypothetical protein [Ottowia testudinis]|uniref:Single-stranded DNA-binding protein n=1 Tax=Ottowia testudinis TaxID=2816950 RepID=A0A975CHD6_9BURK|nr:hypothetical protein [Ottowia testudinis]QTD44219.1 hypothetical protein J1M35_13935 [Ottowia testudinis]
MFDTLISGATLYQPAQAKTASNGNPFAVASFRCNDSGGQAHFISVIAFADEPRDALLALVPGDRAAITGALSVSTREQGGRTFVNLKLTAHRVLSVYQANSASSTSSASPSSTRRTTGTRSTHAARQSAQARKRLETPVTTTGTDADFFGASAGDLNGLDSPPWD